jgi:uncharacterized repeat protein (TIGR03943 family)
VNRPAQAALLFLVGGAMLHASYTDLYLRYVKAGLRPVMLGAGVALIATALATGWYERRRPHAARANDHDNDRAHDGRDDTPHDQVHHGHGHGHRAPLISWLLVLPLFALILVAPPALGSYTAVHTGTALQRPWGFPTLPAGDSVQLGAEDYATRAVYDHGRSLRHRRFELTGFLTLDSSGRPYLTRMVLNCCAADAQPVKIGLSGNTPPLPQPDTWFQVVGTYTAKQTKDPVNGAVIPYIDVSRSTKIPAPKDPYESWTSEA